MERFIISTSGKRIRVPPQLSVLFEDFFPEFRNYLVLLIAHPIILFRLIINDIEELFRRTFDKFVPSKWFDNRLKVIKQMLKSEPKYIEIQLKNRKSLYIDCSPLKSTVKSRSNEGDIYVPLHEALARTHETIYSNQYNVSVSNMKNKIVVDAGANTGVFSIYAALLGAKKVYAFEPVSSTYKIMVENIKKNHLEKIIVPVRAGLWNIKKRTVIAFSFPGDSCANLTSKSSLHPHHKMREKIKLVDLDSFMKGNKCDFIKIDAEGCEYEIIKGAKNTIKKWKPILSFSAYHFTGDRKKLPGLVKSFRKDYDIRLNNFEEPVFFCE